MARRARPKWPPLPKRAYGSGSLSRDQATGEIRARLPKRISQTRQSRLFAPGEVDDAGAWLDAQLRPTEVVAGPGETLGEWTGYWYRTYVQPLHPENTVRWQLYALRKLEPLYSVTLIDLRLSMLQARIGELASQLDPATIKGVISIWRKCLEAAIDDGLIDRFPSRRLKAPAGERRRKTERRHLTPDEASRLWQAIRGHRFEAGYALMLGCGLRIGEILGLAWEYVDLDAGRAWIQRQFTNGHWRPMPKGRNPHWVPLPPPVVAALRRHRDRQPEHCTLVMQSLWPRPPKRRRDEGPRPWSRTVVISDLTSLLETLKIGHATPHASRHGLATHWLDNGVPPAVVAERLGHAHAGTTLSFYAHGSQEGHRRADELTSQLLGETGDDGIPEAESA